MSEVVLKMAFMKNYEEFEELQNKLANFRCLLHTQHVKYFAFSPITVVVLVADLMESVEWRMTS